MDPSRQSNLARSATPYAFPIEASSAIASTSRPSRIVEIRPVRTDLGPISTNVRTPELKRFSISLTNSTGRANCLPSNFRASSGSVGYASPVVLEKTLTVVGWISTFFNVSEMLSISEHFGNLLKMEHSKTKNAGENNIFPKLSKEDILFPHSEIREIQDGLIKEVVNVLEQKKHLIAHAPTGLGKTSASIPIALSYAMKNRLLIDKTAYFANDGALIMSLLLINPIQLCVVNNFNSKYFNSC